MDNGKVDRLTTDNNWSAGRNKTRTFGHPCIYIYIYICVDDGKVDHNHNGTKLRCRAEQYAMQLARFVL